LALVPVLLLGFLSLSLAPTPNSSVTGGTVQADEGAPNIVVLLIDTLRADHLSCYGYLAADGQKTSPVLDTLAAEGTLFSNAWAQAPWTRPSVASLMTGLYPTSHDTVTMYDRMPDGLQTLGTLLRSRGYQTAAFSANAQVSPNFGFHRGFDTFWTDVSYSLRNYCALASLRTAVQKFVRNQMPWLVEALREPGGASKNKSRSSEARKLNLEVEEWLTKKATDQPALLYVQYIDPHDPYDAPEGWQPEGLPGVWEILADIPHSSSRTHPPVPLDGSAFPKPEQTSVDGLLAHYDAEIRYCDMAIGELLAELRTAGMLGPEDYLLITSDHGEEFYDHQQWKHGHSLFREMIRVPLIVVGPNSGAGQVVDTPVQLVDVLPTVAQWTGGPVDFLVHGRDLNPLLQGGQPAIDIPIYSERPKGAYPLQALRLGNRKIVRIGPVESEEALAWMEFDLSSDPFEKDNLVTQREPSADLMELLNFFRTSSLESRLEKSGKTELRGDVGAQLESLGYLDE
ncbi:MAG: sulfatase, partial [Planctomycetes bacterium]|nr:sulfatase [Planctomycetota bacterium]